MAVSKIINSIKVDTSDVGKFLKVNSEGEIELVQIRVPTDKYVVITSHDTESLGPSSGNVTYAIDEFQGDGLDTDNIKGFLIYAYAGGSNSHNAYVWYIDPDGVYHILQYSRGGNSDDDCWSATTVYVPIQEGQTSIELQTQQGANWTIVGAIQNEYTTL